MAQLESGTGPCPRNLVFYGVAGGVSFSGAAAELPGAGNEERCRRLADGFRVVWVFTHHEWWVSKLAIRDSGVDRRFLLRVDMAEDGIDFCVGIGARRGGCFVAFFVQGPLGAPEV